MTEKSGFDLSAVYDHLIDWPARLNREGKYFRPLFDRLGVETVLDAACGTGRHAAMFHSWGLRVEGADVDPVMIEKAREAFGEPEGLTWAVRGYDEPVPAAGSFDAALCVGNSLSLADGPATAGRAVAAMIAALKEGGSLLVQLLNHWRLKEGPCTWQKCMRIADPGGDAFAVKGMHRQGSRTFIEILVLPVAGACELKRSSFTLINLEAGELEEMARAAGAAKVEIFGGYGEVPYERETSVDLVMVARK